MCGLPFIINYAFARRGCVSQAMYGTGKREEVKWVEYTFNHIPVVREGAGEHPHSSMTSLPQHDTPPQHSTPTPA